MGEAPARPIAVLIPTLRRPDSLARTLESLAAQTGGGDLIDTVVVVDNSPEASARGVVERFAERAPWPVRFVHEPRPGVATARNRGLAEITAPYVAFIDDDEAAAPDWLARLHAVHRRFDADVTFGRVQGVAADAPAWARAYLDRFFSREGPEVSGPTEAIWGCGNSMMTRATALAGPEPFEVACDETGGEDDRLFSRVKAAGGRFAWAADAVVQEHAPAHRATVAYAMQRAFGYGQSPCQIAWRAGDRPGVAKWMAVGAAQTVGYGLAAAALFPIARTRSLTLADRAAQGLGKLVWFKAPRFYGATALRRRRTVSAAARAGTAAARPAPG